jgi:hypothetical protein
MHKHAKAHVHISPWGNKASKCYLQANNPTSPRNTITATATAKMDSSDDDTIDYTSWTPEQLMRDYHGELKYELLVRCMEWYTNSEVEARINAGRTDGSKIQNSNFYAEFKRNLEIVALRDGHLPTEYRLQFDKRRFINFEARFGSNDRAVKMLRNSVRRRDAVAGTSIRPISSFATH